MNVHASKTSSSRFYGLWFRELVVVGSMVCGLGIPRSRLNMF